MHATAGIIFLGILAAFTLVAAGLVYWGRPWHPTNRLLALALFFQAVGETTVALGMAHDLAARIGGTHLGLRVVFFVAILSWIILYLLFLGTMRTPLSRPLRSTPVRTLLVLYWMVLAGWAVFSPHDLLSDVSSPPSLFLIVPLILMGIYGIFVAFEMWHRAPGGLARRQAGAFLLAFGIRDLGFLVFGLFAVAGTFADVPDLAVPVLRRLPSLVNFLSALILTYGILSVQLLDIDLKIKWGIRRGTLLAIFLAGFVATTEIVSEFVTTERGIWAGLGVTMLLVLAIGPLQRLADRVADRAMPRVRDDQEYRLVRRNEVYEAALRSAIADGLVTDRERDVLATLADQLGLTSVEALALERQVTGARETEG